MGESVVGDNSWEVEVDGGRGEKRMGWGPYPTKCSPGFFNEHVFYKIFFI